MNQIKKTWIQQHSKLLLQIGLVLIVSVPTCVLIFWKSSGIPGESGQLGDTIGGLTAPFVNLIAALLIYLALRAQLDANDIILGQVESQATDRSRDDESRNINHLFNSLKTSIDNFTYTSLNPDDFGKGRKLEGSEAIYKLFHDFYCNYHGSKEEMKANPKLTELKSILELCLYLLQKIDNSDFPDKEALRFLSMQQYTNRIIPRLKRVSGSLKPYKCEDCKKYHGLPRKLINLIKQIDIYIALNNASAKLDS